MVSKHTFIVILYLAPYILNSSKCISQSQCRVDKRFRSTIWRSIDQMADESVSATASAPVQQLVTADGTYATQSALSGPSSSEGAKGKSKEERPPFRKYLMDGDFFIAASLATTLTKLALRYNAAVGDDEKKRNRFTSETMLVLASVLHLGRSGLPAKKITPDDGDRIALCLKVLAEQSPTVVEIFDRYCLLRIWLQSLYYRWCSFNFFMINEQLTEPWWFNRFFTVGTMNRNDQ